MKKIFYLLVLLMASWMTPLSIAAQCPGATRNATDCKAGTENAIGWAMKNFFQDGSTFTWNWESGAKFVENTDGTADLTGIIAHFGNPTTRRFQVNIHFISQTFTAPPGSPILFNTTPSTVGWYYYDWGTSTLTGLNDLAGAKLTLQKRDKPIQVGTGAADQIEEIGKLSANGWFSWSIVSQPTNNWLVINPFPQNPSVDEADICIGLSGQPTNCGDPCDSDATSPTFTNCPANINLTTINTCAVANWIAPTANDNCGTPSVSLTTSPTAGLGIGSCFPVGTTTVTYKATDAKGNIAVCFFTVTVVKNNTCDTDTDPPTFANCPANINLTTTNNCAVANWIAPTANDNCGIPSVSLTTFPTAGLGIGSCFPVGTTTVTYKATDAKGNMTTCIFTVKVTPQGNILDCNNVNLRSGNSAITVGGLTAPYVNIQAYKVFDYGGWLSVFECVGNQCSRPTQTITNLQAGNYKVFVTFFNDKWEQVCVIDKDIVVTTNGEDPCDTDATPPTFTNCPTNITLSTANSCAVANWVAPTATDNCGTPAVSLTTAPTTGLGIGSCFPVGTTTVTYKATDAKGNSATCAFTVTVTKTNPCDTDNEPPTFTNCPTNITLSTANGCAVANWVAPTATDNCGTPSVSVTSTPTAGLSIGSCFPVGTTTVTYKATDAKGNSAICTFTVKVVKIITCNNVTNAGKINKSCVDGKVTLTNIENPSGGSGTLEYVWLKSTVRCPPGNHDEVVPNSNAPTLAVGSVTQKTYYVRCVRRVGCTTVDDFVESNCITVSPNDCSNGLLNGDCAKITNKKSAKTIDVYQSLTWSGTKIIQKSYESTKSQKWTFKNLGNGYYIIISKNSGKVLDIDGTGDYCATGSHLIQDYYDGSKSQQFKLVKHADGSYKIINRRCNKVLKVYNARSDSGASIVLGEDSDSDHSKWLIDKVDCPSSSYHLTGNTVFTLEANAQFNRTHLEWINNTTIQNDYFSIQKINSQSGNFEDIETINAIEGIDELQYYTSYDNNPNDGENYYRIKLVYQDARVEYSETKVVNFKGLSDVRIFPNPSDDFVDVDLAKYKNKEVGIYLYNAFGQPVRFVNIEKVGDTPVRLDVSKFNSGNFLLRITSKGKRDVTKQLIITR